MSKVRRGCGAGAIERPASAHVGDCSCAWVGLALSSSARRASLFAGTDVAARIALRHQRPVAAADRAAVRAVACSAHVGRRRGAAANRVAHGRGARSIALEAWHVRALRRVAAGGAGDGVVPSRRVRGATAG